MKKFSKWLFLAVSVLFGVEAMAQQLAEVQLKALTGEMVPVPEFGKKHLLIFYVDPDRHKQNEAFTYELEENHRAESPNIEAFGVLNLKDTFLPNALVRSLAKKRTEKNGALVLADEDRTLATKWGLGDCNNQFVLIFVSNKGELVFLRKGELSEQDKEEFYKVIEQYK
ncbi:MAG: hypothetical protein IJ990_00160 [Alistipes sp.]|nr:hypothetical protein [Alistipes sp.]